MFHVPNTDIEHFSAGRWVSAAGDGSAPCPEQLNEGGGRMGHPPEWGVREAFGDMGPGAGEGWGGAGFGNVRYKSVGGAVACNCCHHIKPKIKSPNQKSKIAKICERGYS